MIACFATCVCTDLEPRTPHTHAHTYTHTTPCPPANPPPRKTIPLHLILVLGLCSRAVNNFWAHSQELSSAKATLSILSILFYNCNILIFSGQVERRFQPSEMNTHRHTQLFLLSHLRMNRFTEVSFIVAAIGSYLNSIINIIIILHR